MANCALVSAPRNTPPSSMNFRRLISPSKPMPIRVSSVCAKVTRFGVSVVFL